MRYHFCGKQDCPDWILAELFHASHLDVERFANICEAVRDTILADGKLEQHVWQRLDLETHNIGTEDAKACFATVNFIITNSCIYQVDGQILCRELEQLGLPSDHCQRLGAIISASGQQIREHIGNN